MKKIITFLLTFLGIFLIYYHFNIHTINYISIGDNVMNNNFNNYNTFIKEYLIRKEWLGNFNTSFYNKTVLSLYEDIKNNRTIRNGEEDYYIKKVLRESDVLVISVGMEELSKNYNKYNMDHNYIFFNKMYVDIEKLVCEVTKYAKGKILFLGYYNPTDYYDSTTDEFFCDIDIKLNRLMMINDIYYIDLYEQVKGNRYKDNLNSTFLNIRGNEKIAEIIEFYFE